MTFIIEGPIMGRMGGRYGKYGEIKRIARLRKRTMGLPFMSHGGKKPLEMQRHEKGLPHRQDPKKTHLFVKDDANEQGPSR